MTNAYYINNHELTTFPTPPANLDSFSPLGQAIFREIRARRPRTAKNFDGASLIRTVTEKITAKVQAGTVRKTDGSRYQPDSVRRVVRHMLAYCN
jgi:hypothetical protein